MALISVDSLDKQLVYNFDDPKAFAKASQFAVTAFRNSDNQLITLRRIMQ
jgi:hypothetical protein